MNSERFVKNVIDFNKFKNDFFEHDWDIFYGTDDENKKIAILINTLTAAIRSNTNEILIKE